MIGEPPTAPTLADLVSSSPSLGRLVEGLRRGAATDAPILVLGEAGTGRSTVARAVHRESGRSGPLVELDPGAIPPSLFESELFGYRAGAFTGADDDLPGRVERAAGGTLLLDHLEEIPVAVQPKLLRLVAERRYSPLGGGEREADVRFVSVGPEDLPERVERGAFRSDLFYRLEVVAFRLPPLRERGEDLEVLVESLVADVATRLGRPAPPVDAGALEWMSRYRWPGNLRELRNVLERAMVLAAPAEPLSPPPPDRAVEAKPRRLSEVEAEEIRRALAYTRGHQGRAAEILGISRKALWEKRKRHGIP